MERLQMERSLATPADAEIILKLYDLRREELMRKARAWVIGEFWPATADEYFAVAMNPADSHNAYVRQVISFWEMAAALVLHGTVSAELFIDCNQEACSFSPSSSRSSTECASAIQCSWPAPRTW